MQYKLYQISNRQVSTLITKLIHNILVSVLRSVTVWHVTRDSRQQHWAQRSPVSVSTSAETLFYIESAVPYSDHQICSIQRGYLETLKSVEVSWFLVSHFTLSPHSARLIGSVQCLECQSAARVTLITPPPGAFIADTDSSLLSRKRMLAKFAQSWRRLLLGSGHYRFNI